MCQVEVAREWCCVFVAAGYPDSKANMGPIWGRQDPGGSHVGAMNFAIWVYSMVEATTIWNKQTNKNQTEQFGHITNS